MEDRAERRSDQDGEALSLEVAYATLTDLLLDRPDTETFLHRIAELAASIVPGARCSVLLHGSRADSGARVDPADPRDDLPRQQRVGRPREEHDHAAVAGEASGVASLPLYVDGVTLGTLTLEADAERPVRAADLDRARAFARQAATTLTLLEREAAHVALDEELQEALVTRAVIDQAMGVLMHARRISGRQALEKLRRESQTTNRKVSVLAAELVLAMTGHPAERPRPLTLRSHSPLHHRHHDDIGIP